MIKNTLIGLVKFIVKVILGFILFLLMLIAHVIVAFPIVILIEKTTNIILIILILGGILVSWHLGDRFVKFIKEKILKRKRKIEGGCRR